MKHVVPLLAGMLIAQSASASITTMRLGPAQIFDTQYSWSSSTGDPDCSFGSPDACDTINVSGLTRPYDSTFNQPAAGPGQFFAFFESSPCTFGLALYDADGTQAAVLHDSGTFLKLSDGAIFYLGSGFFGTLISPSAGLEDGSAASLTVGTGSPDCAALQGFTPPSLVPLGVGEVASPPAGDPPAEGPSAEGGDPVDAFAVAWAIHQPAATRRLRQMAAVTLGATLRSNERFVDRALTRLMGGPVATPGAAPDRGMARPLPLGLSTSGRSDDLPVGGILSGVWDGPAGSRLVLDGEFALARPGTGARSAGFSLRVAQEWQMGARGLAGLFLGADAASARSRGNARDEVTTLIASLGAYGAMTLSEGLFATGFVSYGLSRNDLTLSGGGVEVDGDGTARVATVGASLTGRVLRGEDEFRPRLTASYARTWLGDVGLAATIGGSTRPVTLSAGTVSVGRLAAIAEWRRTVWTAGLERGVLSLAPMAGCDWIDIGTSARKCGGGIAIGLEGSLGRSGGSVGASLGYERFGDREQTVFAASLTHRF